MPASMATARLSVCEHTFLGTLFDSLRHLNRCVRFDPQCQLCLPV